jgi:Fe2+ transport system protein FeoA
MDSEFLTCPFCGFEFEKADSLCHHGCPLGAWCKLNRCPNCQYEFAEQPKAVSWLENLLRRRPKTPRRELPEAVMTVRDLRPSDQARVLCLGAGAETRHNNLAVFGVVPGAEITVVQQRPALVLRVGETELALDPAIAKEIMVERVEAESVPA